MDDLDRYYEILGVKPGDSIDEIKQCYRDLVKIWHPDRFSNNPRLQHKAHEKLKEINRAYRELCFIIINENKRKPKDDIKYESKSSYDDDLNEKDGVHSDDELYYPKQSSNITYFFKEYWGFILIGVIFGGSITLNHIKKDPYPHKAKPIYEYQRTLPKEYKIIPKNLSPNYQPFTPDKYSKFHKNQLPSVNIPSEPINPKSLPIGSSPFGIGVKNGNSMITIDNGTKDDALVRLIRFSHNEEKIRNFYIPAGKQYTAKKIPQGLYKLRIAFGKDWDNKLRRFNFNRHFSETESFDITETSWIETTDDGFVERIRFSKMNITLHKVMYGNFKSHEISEEDFNK